MRGTIRKEFAESIEANSVHGSDSHDSAASEIKHFFTEDEIVANLAKIKKNKGRFYQAAFF